MNTNTHASRQMNKIVGKETTPTIKIVGFTPIGANRARIVADVVHTSTSRQNHNEVAAELASKFDNKLAAMDGSFTSLNSGNYVERVQGVMKLNVQARAYEEGMAGFRSVSSNLFMDDEDSMWALRKTESGDLLVKDLGIGDHDSLRHMLQVVCSGVSLSSRDMREVSTALSSITATLKGGDFIKYASKSGEVRYGFIVTAGEEENSLIVLPTGSENPEEVEGEAVLDSYDTEQFPEVELSQQEQVECSVSAARGVVDLNTILAFYKKVYARSSKFYNEFAQRAKEHCFC